MHIRVFMSSNFYDQSIGEVGLWFGGQFCELKSPKLWSMVETIIVEGRKDDYSLQEVTTTAMAEGAIEGEASDYKLPSAYETKYRFSRFDAVKASPRDITQAQLTEEKRVDITRILFNNFN